MSPTRVRFGNQFRDVVAFTQKATRQCYGNIAGPTCSVKGAYESHLFRTKNQEKTLPSTAARGRSVVENGWCPWALAQVMTHLSRPHERMATFFPSDVCQRRSSRMPCSNIPKCPFQGLGWRWRKQGRTQRIRLFTVLCAERVGQMTKTYNDIDAVTRLLEEKDWDLELAARIGQSLLKRNRVLSEQNEYLEEQVGTIREEAHEQIHYNVQMKVSNSLLHHELNLKDELLQFYTNAVEESEEGSGSPTRQQGRAGVSAHSGSSLDFLQQKLQDLEEENLSLRSEASQLKSETESYEEKEQQLVNDCVRELRQSSIQISSIAEELAKKTEDASRQQEEITHLLSQIVDLQKKSKTV